MNRQYSVCQLSRLSHEELYSGLPKEQAAGWRKEATEEWGKDAIERSEMRLLTMTREDLAALKKAFTDNCSKLASMGQDPASAEVQAAWKAQPGVCSVFMPGHAAFCRVALTRDTYADEPSTYTWPASSSIQRTLPGLVDTPAY